MVHLKSSAECLVFLIAGGEDSFQGWDGTWAWASIQLVCCPQGTALKSGSAVVRCWLQAAALMMGDGAIWPCAIERERAVGEHDGRRAMDRIWPRSGGRQLREGGCAGSRGEPCALRFVPLDEQTVPRRNDVTSHVLRPACAVLPGLSGLSGACVRVCMWCAGLSASVSVRVRVSACAQAFDCRSPSY